MRIFPVLSAAACLTAALAVTLGYRNATAAPVVRYLTIHSPDRSSEARPLRVVLFSDLHVQGPDMPPSRLARITAQINALDPDIDLIAGDFVGSSRLGKAYSPDEAVTPLRDLRTRFGVYAVLGNNDDQPAATRAALERAGIRLLMNEAVSVGPVAVGGLDGRLAHSATALRAARTRAFDSLRRLPGFKILIAHRPDEFVAAPPFINLTVAGHTHCGQVVLPIVGALLTGSDYGRKYVCGVYRDESKILVVTAGLGTSHIPVRMGAPPDIWLIILEGVSNSGEIDLRLGG
jgi:predicted MPP superfamily phosphohydrolase